MQALLAACRELALEYNTVPKLFLNIKRNPF